MGQYRQVSLQEEPPEANTGEVPQPKGHSRSCAARAKGWKTGAKRNVQSRDHPDLLQATFTRSTCQAKKGIFVPSVPPQPPLYALLLPNPCPPKLNSAPQQL